MDSEKTYKLMGGIGAGDIVLGIVVLVTGITAGVMMIVNGARLLKGTTDLMF